MSAQPAGYSGTPLPQKLGIKPGHRAAFPHAPADFRDTLGTLPDGVSLLADGDAGAADVVVFFTKSAEELRGAFGGLGARVHPAGMLWIAWPKKASGVATDLGLKFVYRLADRPKR
jgi:hypothetical protein